MAGSVNLLASYGTASTGTISIIAHVSAANLTGGGSGTATTGTFNSTGANAIILWVPHYALGTTPSITDSKSNTYILIRDETTPTTNAAGAFYRCWSPTVGTGHTVTATGTFYFPTVFVWALGGVDVAVGVDKQSGTNSNGVALNAQPGSITPAYNNSLILCGSSEVPASGSASINSSFTISSQFPTSAGISYESLGAYLQQTSATAVNPTVTFGGSSTTYAVAQISLKPV